MRVLYLLLLAVALGCDDDDPKKYTVVYEVEGTVFSAEISYQSESVGFVNVGVHQMPWLLDGLQFQSGDSVRLVAKKSANSYMEAVARIYLNGVAWKMASATVPGGTAEVAGVLP